MVIFNAKLVELQHQLAYLHIACAECRQYAHPDAAERLRHFDNAISSLRQTAAGLEVDLDRYQAAQRPAADTWRQIFTRLRGLSGDVQAFRTQYLPAYLASTPHDHYMSNVFKQLHQEVGLLSVHPVVSLHQPYWFAVLGDIPEYPLYFAPASLVSDPSELGLVYHEIGHTLFKLWGDPFAQVVKVAIIRAIQRKVRDLQSMPDPASRKDYETALTKWQSKAYYEMEESACDAVGTYLGGPAFVTAARMSLLLMDDNPFISNSSTYPPLDCRMRLGSIILRRLGLADQALDILDAGWDRVQALSRAQKSRWYDRLYDDQYLIDIAEAVEGQLRANGLSLYHPSSGGLRQRLSEGAGLVLADSAAHADWRHAFRSTLEQTYAP